MAAGTAVWEAADLRPYGIVRWNGITQFHGLLQIKGVALLCSALNFLSLTPT